MAVKIGSARMDENGKATGGKSGDQTGKELSKQDWYLHSKGWVVLRAKDAEVAAKIAKAMNAACDNNLIGYDQYQNQTLWNEAKKVGFDPAKVMVECETDCARAIRVCAAAAGVMAEDFYTATEVAALMATGAFDKLTAAQYTKSSDYLRAGDILVTKTKGHTVVVLSDGPLASAGKDGTAGDSQNPYTKPKSGSVQRKGAKGEGVCWIQWELRDSGYERVTVSGQTKALEIDGEFGVITLEAVKQFQKRYGLEVDGEVGNETRDMLVAKSDGKDAPATPSIPIAPPEEKWDAVIVDLDQHSDLKSTKNDWDKYCKAVDMTILRCGVTRTETKPIGIGIDDHFAYVAKQLNARNHPFGVYYYGKVKTADEARKEARKAFETASPYNPLFYCYDVEEGRLTSACLQAFADELRKLGVKKVGLYVGHNYYKTFEKAVEYFDFVWIPRYGKNDGTYNPKYNPAYPCDIHQFTSVGEVPGNHDKTLDINRLTGTKPLSWFTS